MNFFKTLLASMLGTVLALGIIMLIFVLLIVSAVSSSDSKEVKVSENSVLHITLEGTMTERSYQKEFNFSSGGFEGGNTSGLHKFISELERAQKDDRIKGIFLEISDFAAAPSTILDVRRALADFKNSGKWILSYGEDFSQGGYYLASAANEVYLYPQGSLDWRGINAEVSFFKNMLDKLEIEAQVIRGPNNRFKSAVEPFMYDKMSPENKEQIATFIGDIWRTMLDGISASRSIELAQLNQYADSLTLINPEKAVETRMLDGLKYRDEVIAMIKAKLGIEATAPDKDLKLISLADYEDEEKEESEQVKKEKVAVVYAVGAIESGEGDDETIGSDRIAKALKKAREDEKVKAIVLRVNSPGGSALASDVIWRETQLIKQSGKPFYVSMGDYAASGGYYISCAADKIYANQNTITGSIGVFGIVPNVEKFMGNKLGITFDRYETNPHADLISITKPFDEMEMKAMQDMVTQIYDDFTQKVATGRGITQAQVDSIGQGRVWSGEDAKALGLVDEIGNLNDCIKAAAAQAGIAEYEIKSLPMLIDPFQKLMEDLSGKKETQVMESYLGEHFITFMKVKDLLKKKEVQARMPFEIVIQ